MQSHPLIQTLNHFCPLPETLAPTLLEHFKILEFRREDVVLREGFTNRRLFFLESGIIRRHSISPAGQQKTTAFIKKNNFFTDLESFQVKKGSKTTFTAESECKAYSIDFDKLTALMETHPEIKEAFTKIKEHYLTIAADTKTFLAKQPVEKRVEMVVQQFPEVVQTCRKRDIISFLRTNSQTYNFILKGLGMANS